MSEATIHKSIVQYLWLCLPDGSLFHHSPNEGRHHISHRMQQKNLGMCTGWPDLEVFIAERFWLSDKPWAPIFLEVKSAKGRVSPSQADVHTNLTDLGCHVHVVRSIDDAASALRGYAEMRDAYKRLDH